VLCRRDGKTVLTKDLPLPPATSSRQVGSHYNFIETNPLLDFDRMASYGMRLNIPAGTAVRFEPGETKTVTLVAIAGRRVISLFNECANTNSSIIILIQTLIIKRG